jgi:hypothetical protein
VNLQERENKQSKMISRFKNAFPAVNLFLIEAQVSSRRFIVPGKTELCLCGRWYKEFAELSWKVFGAG